ncbi:mitochondrial DNA helicase isoform X2 [Cylas formicarius]|nr:mitochondrial DNA helicase isoform X2 [Cylas formicarius]
MYMCSSCTKCGQWNQLEARLSLKKSKHKVTIKDENDLIKITKLLDQVKQNTMEIKNLREEEFSNLLSQFSLPVLSQLVLECLDVRINKDGTIMYFPLENVKSQTIGYRTLHCSTKDEEILPDIYCGGILTAKVGRSKDTAVLVPTISDFLTLLKSKINVNIVCSPHGVNFLSQYFLPSFERFKKLVLWFGSDTKSWDSARHFSKKLGEKRCFLVKPNELLPHLNENRDFKSVINGAYAVWHKSITTFASLRSGVLSDLQNIDKVQGTKWKRFPTLNKVLLGHRRGELTVFTGPTGSGKTTFISEYSLDLAMQGVNTLWGSFEITNERLARTMLQQMAELPLIENMHLFDELADKFQKLPIYFMTFHGQQSIKVVMEAVEHAAYIYDIGHVVIDNLQFMIGVADETRHLDRFWKQDAIIAAFRTFATRKNCHVTLVIHPRKEKDSEELTTGSIFGGAKASQEADNVLIIQDKRLSSIKGKKYLQIAKNRYSGDLGVMALDFDKKGLSYAQKKLKEKKSVRNEPPDKDGSSKNAEI